MKFIRYKVSRSLMRIICIAVFALAATSGASIAGWEVKTIPKQSGEEGYRHVMIYHTDADRGAKTIVPVVEQLSRAGRLDALQTLTVHDLVKDLIFQNEVLDELQKLAPEALSAARRSAGNMHNPKMTELHPHFSRAVLSTPTVKALNSVLAAHSMKITHASFEKLELQKKDQSESFRCALWLTVEPATPHGSTETKKP